MNSNYLLGTAILLASCSGGGGGSSADPFSQSTFKTASAANPDPLLCPEAASHALSLPGLGDDFGFVSGGQFVEFDDGSACLGGVIARRSDAGQRWILDLRFAGRVGAQAEAPAGSPRRALIDEAYIENGGPIDAALWRYYASTSGTLIGLRDNDGAEVELNGAGQALQLGRGASNRNAGRGASGILAGRTVRQPLDGPALPPDFEDGAFKLSLGGVDSRWATDSIADERYALLPGGHSFWMPAIGGEYSFVSGGRFTELTAGTAILTGVIAQKENSDQRFSVEVEFSGRINPDQPEHPPLNSPKLDLSGDAYKSGGGPIDPSTWHYYTEFRGFLRGMRQYDGGLLEISRRGPAFQVGQAAAGKNLEFGASAWIALELRESPTNGAWLPGFQGDGDINIDLEDETDTCAQAPPADPEYAVFDGGHALFLPGIGEDFVFENPTAFSENADGTAHLVGTVARLSQPNHRFDVDVTLGERIDPWDVAYPPEGSPKNELDHSAYVGQGGPIDPDTWHYYQTTEGTLVGRGEYEGGRIAITRFGPSFQVGVGANSMDLEFGGGGWIALEVLEQPGTGFQFPSFPENGDINLDLNSECEWWASNAEDHSFWLPGIATDFRFDPPGRFIEKADGTARLTGTIVNVLDESQRFAVDVSLQSRLMPGEEGHAPEGSPKMELPASSYVENGGVIDISTWRYFQQTVGTLTGQGSLEGALLEFTRMGPAFQVGFGASGKNERYGASGWIAVTVTEQPFDGPELPPTLNGDMNLDFDRDCF